MNSPGATTVGSSRMFLAVGATGTTTPPHARACGVFFDPALRSPGGLWKNNLWGESSTYRYRLIMTSFLQYLQYSGKSRTIVVGSSFISFLPQAGQTNHLVSPFLIANDCSDIFISLLRAGRHLNAHRHTAAHPPQEPALVAHGVGEVEQIDLPAL